MNNSTTRCLAVFVNFAFCCNQLLAQLPPITFESAEWIPWDPVGQPSHSGWQLLSGNAVVSEVGEGAGGGKAIKIPAGLGETRVTRSVSWDVNEKTAFIDFSVKPSADPEESLSTFYANGTQIA